MFAEGKVVVVIPIDASIPSVCLKSWVCFVKQSKGSSPVCEIGSGRPEVFPPRVWMCQHPANLYLLVWKVVYPHFVCKNKDFLP